MISLSERAAEKVRELLADEADAETLRVAVQGGGCSGFQYALGFDGAPQAGDEIVEQYGVTVIVDRFSLPYLEGANVDYVDGLMGQGFTVENPNASASLRLRPELPGRGWRGPRRCRRLWLRLQSLTRSFDASFRRAPLASGQ